MGEGAKENWGSGYAYELWVGRWSRLVAKEFINWLAVSSIQTWGDVGCGTGALVECVLGSSAPAGALGVDRSEAYISEARNRVGVARAHFEVGDGCALTWDTATCDVTVSGLALNFVPDSDAMTREMVRVTRPAETRDRIRDTLKARLVAAADGSIAMTARAWAVQGTVPPNPSPHPTRAGGRRHPTPASEH